MANEVPQAPVWNYAQLFAEPQTAARQLRVTVRDVDGNPIDLLGSPFQIEGSTLPVASAPPLLGQDTDAVLSELLGLDAAELGKLRRRRVI